MNKTSFFKALCLLSIGCSLSCGMSRSQLAALSVGQIACPGKEIEVSDIVRAGRNINAWTSTCRGKNFYCNTLPAAPKAINVRCRAEQFDHDEEVITSLHPIYRLKGSDLREYRLATESDDDSDEQEVRIIRYANTARKNKGVQNIESHLEDKSTTKEPSAKKDQKTTDANALERPGK